MLWTKTDRPELKPRWLINGFPKAGLHLLEGLLKPVAIPVPGCAFHPNNWWGNIKWNAWSKQFDNIEKLTYVFFRLGSGQFFKSHTAYMPEIERFMYLAGTAHVFIYRDLRDVAVSQAYHVLSQDTRLMHPAKGFYAALEMEGGFDAVLSSIIEGTGPFPGVIERWEMFAPWLNIGWTLSARFEDILSDPRKFAQGMLEYGTFRFAGVFPDEKFTIDTGEMASLTEEMAESASRKDQSLTFRKGEVGGWKEVFKPEHKKLWKKHDPDCWLKKLGYETRINW